MRFSHPQAQPLLPLLLPASGGSISGQKDGWSEGLVHRTTGQGCQRALDGRTDYTV